MSAHPDQPSHAGETQSHNASTRIRHTSHTLHNHSPRPPDQVRQHIHIRAALLWRQSRPLRPSAPPPRTSDRDKSNPPSSHARATTSRAQGGGDHLTFPTHHTSARYPIGHPNQSGCATGSRPPGFLACTPSLVLRTCWCIQSHLAARYLGILSAETNSNFTYIPNTTQLTSTLGHHHARSERPHSPYLFTHYAHLCALSSHYCAEYSFRRNLVSTTSMRSLYSALTSNTTLFLPSDGTHPLAGFSTRSRYPFTSQFYHQAHTSGSTTSRPRLRGTITAETNNNSALSSNTTLFPSSARINH